jgi:two-component system cell cycle response regulator
MGVSEKKPRTLGAVITTLVGDAVPAPVGRARPVLTVLVGSDLGRVLSIPHREVIAIGRAETCKFHFDEISISSLHGHVFHMGEECSYNDAGSTNGSFVNDTRVTQTVILRDGDRLRLGPTTLLRFSYVDETEELALKKVYEAALYDGLTGIYNRKYLDDRIESELGFALRHGTELSLILVDVDHFKKVNDTHGHLAGDAVLKGLAGVIGRELRAEDVLARYGGEEFVVLLRNIHAAGAFVLADRLRQTVSQSPVPFASTPITITISGGVASLTCCGERRDKEALFGMADARLYVAKKTGRNRIVGRETP